MAPGSIGASTMATPLRYSLADGSGQAEDLHQHDRRKIGNPASEKKERAASSKSTGDAWSPGRLDPNATTARTGRLAPTPDSGKP